MAIKKPFGSTTVSRGWPAGSFTDTITVTDPINVAPFKLAPSSRLLSPTMSRIKSGEWEGEFFGNNEQSRADAVNIYAPKARIEYYLITGIVETQSGLIFIGDYDALKRACFLTNEQHRDAYEELIGKSKRHNPIAFILKPKAAALDGDVEVKWVSSVCNIQKQEIGVIFHAKYGPGVYKVICGYDTTMIASVAVTNY